MFSSQRKDSVPLVEIDGLHQALIRDGFKLDQNLMSVDEMVVSRIPGVRSIVSAFYPASRKQSVNRIYSKDGAKLGIDYEVRGEQALAISMPADAAHCGRARKMAAELSAINPNMIVWLRTNDPPIAAKR